MSMIALLITLDFPVEIQILITRAYGDVWRLARQQFIRADMTCELKSRTIIGGIVP